MRGVCVCVWLWQEYKQGCALELYSTHLADDLVGLTFLDVATAVYTRFNGEAICWGVLHHPSGATCFVVACRRGTSPLTIILFVQTGRQRCC